jgi:hypothetical protein
MLDIVAWLTDADGSALFVPLGPVAADAAGTVTLTATLPPAEGILALAFTPPSLPKEASIGVELSSLTTDAGDVNWTGETDIELSGAGRLLPLGSGTGIPVVVTTALSERLDAPVGSDLGVRIGGLPSQLPIHVVAVLDELPGIAAPVGMILDLQSLESAALAIGGSVPAADQLWLTAEDPDAAIAALRTSLTVRADLVTASTVSTRPVMEPAIALFTAGAAATLLLAVLGFAAVAASIGRQRRVEFIPLRSLGLTAARVRGARAIELVASAVLAIVLGAAGGILTAWLVVPGLVAVAT